MSTNEGSGGGGACSSSSSSKKKVPPPPPPPSSSRLHQQQNGTNNNNNNNEEEDDEFVEDDDCCVYTYKGDPHQQQQHNHSKNGRAADLPSSFFHFSPPPPHPPPFNNHHHVVNNPQQQNNGENHHPQVEEDELNSPDMDFLEMDFDPAADSVGGHDFDDDDEDDHNRRQEDVRRNMHEPNGGLQHRIDVIQHDPPVPTDNPPAAAAPTTSNELLLLPLSPSSSSTDPSTSRRVTLPSSGASTATLANTANPHHHHHLSIRLVKSNTLPDLNNSSLVAPTTNTSSTPPTSSSSSSTCSLCSSPMSREDAIGRKTTAPSSAAAERSSVDVRVNGAMIWSLEEAFEKVVRQNGASTCGATAIIHVLTALGVSPVPSEVEVSAAVGTRSRLNDADLPEYLFSRSDAGATHEDLIRGMHAVTGGTVVGRFFQINPYVASAAAVSKWILKWICRGAVPVLTLNPQKKVEDNDDDTTTITNTILPLNSPINTNVSSSPAPPPAGQPPSSTMSSRADAWHHQMVFGLTESGLYLANPVELVSMGQLIPQLTSESVLLVRRQDVVSRKGPRTDLRKLARHPNNPLWNQFNVLGQVSNMLLEELPVINGSSLAKRVRSTHVAIPAAYKAGITLFVRAADANAVALLHHEHATCTLFYSQSAALL